MAKITDLKAFEILDSRGNPTIQAQVVLDNGQTALAAVPSGASKGKHEAWELRDGDPERFLGLGVLKAVETIEKVIFPALRGLDPLKQKQIDEAMMELDGTENKSKLGANSLLSVSLAVCRAASLSLEKPLYQYLADLHGESRKSALPTPMFNIVNGGLHGSGSFNIQEFMVVPSPKYPFAEALKTGAEIYLLLKKHLRRKNLWHSVGDEGGFTPNLQTNEDVLALLKEVIEGSKYRYGEDVSLGLDLAASTFYDGSTYEVDKGKKRLTNEEYFAYLKDLNEKFDLLSLEDALPEDDWEGWRKLTATLGQTKMIIGDDLLVTNLARLKTAIEKKACNAILIKVNQIGTLTETLEVIKEARREGFKIIISHRSGETTDDFIADLAVAVGADFTKFGAPARGERVAKYNRLLAISRQTSSL